VFDGCLIDRAGAAAIFARFESHQAFDVSFLQPTPPEAILLRMLNNLRTLHLRQPDAPSLLAVLELLTKLPGCPPDEFEAFCEAHPDRTVVVYANTSVKVKALSDWVVTSSVGLSIVEALSRRGEKILWAPDKHLGRYIQHKTGADMLLWSGACSATRTPMRGAHRHNVLRTRSASSSSNPTRSVPRGRR